MCLETPKGPEMKEDVENWRRYQSLQELTIDLMIKQYSQETVLLVRCISVIT